MEEQKVNEPRKQISPELYHALYLKSNEGMKGPGFTMSPEYAALKKRAYKAQAQQLMHSKEEKSEKD